MSTTDAALVSIILSCLEASDIRFAVLHGEPAIASEAVTSDVDLVVGEVPRRLIAEIVAPLRDLAVLPVLYWPYDVGGAATVFFATEDGSAGAQFDFLHDPAGVGQDGLRTNVALDGSLPGNRWPRVSPTHELLYLIRKRHRKGDTDALKDLLSNAKEADWDLLRSEMASLFPKRISRQLASLIGSNTNDHPAPRRPRFYPFRDLVRKLRRLRSPIGFWLATGTQATAEKIVDQFKVLLPHVDSGVRPQRRAALWLWYLREVVPVRYRPGIFVSWPPRGGRPRPDGEIAGADEHHAGHRLVNLMAARLVQ